MRTLLIKILMVASIGLSPTISFAQFTVISNQTNPVGIETDLEQNIHVSHDMLFNVAISKLNPNGIQLGQLQYGGIAVGDLAHLIRIPEKNTFLGLTNKGWLFVYDPKTVQGSFLFNFKNVSIDASRVYDIFTGTFKTAFNIVTQLSSYGDISAYVSDGNLHLYLTGLQQNIPFIVHSRLNLNDYSFLDGKIIITSSSFGGVTNLTRGIAINKDGLVLSTMPFKNTAEFAIKFKHNFNETNPPFVFDQIQMYSRGICTDPDGNFYVATGSRGLTLQGLSVGSAIVQFDNDIQRIKSVIPAGLITSTVDVATDPKGEYLYVTSSNFSGRVVRTEISNFIPWVHIDVVETTQTTCEGSNDGTAKILLNTEGDFEYSIDGKNYFNTNFFENLSKGTYNAYVRLKSNPSSQISKEFNISSPESISINFNQVTSPNCPSDNTGSFIAKASGGTGNYFFKLQSQEDFNSDGIFSDLVEGKYQVTVKDENGCEARDEIEIKATGELPAIPSVSVQAGNGPSEVILQSSSPSGNQWYRNGTEIQGATGQNYQITQPGNYKVFVTNSSGCSSVSEEIEINWYPIEIEKIETSPVSCHGSNDASAKIAASVGSGNLQYSLDGTNFSDKNTLQNLAAGEHTVFVRGSGNSNYVVNQKFAITSPAPLSLTFQNVVQPNCTGDIGGGFRIVGQGGNGNYSYKLDSQANFQTNPEFSNLPERVYDVTVKDENGCEVTEQIEIKASGQLPDIPFISIQQGNDPSEVFLQSNSANGYQWLRNGSEIQGATGQNYKISQSGSYEVKVTNGSGCSSISENLQINWYPITIENIETSSVSCHGSNDGSAKISASVGSGNLQYSLDGTNFSDKNTLQNLAAGDYNVFVRGSGNSNYVVNQKFAITSPAPLSLTFQNMVQPNCPGDIGGGFRIVGQGGNGNYSYKLDNQANFQTSQEFRNLPERVYVVTVKDGNGCVTTEQIEIKASGQLPEIPSISIQQGNDRSEVFLQSNSANGNQWLRNGSEIQGATGQNYKISQSGSYQVKVTNTSGCSSISETIQINWYPITIENIETSPVSCHGSNDGSAKIAASVGSGNLQYSLDGTNFSDKNTLQNLAAGEYTVFVRGSGNSNYVVNQKFAITSPAPLSLTFQNVVQPNCTGDLGGGFRVVGEGGNGNYSYKLDNQSNFQTNPEFGNLPERVYEITVRDAKGCETKGQLEIKAIGQYPSIPTITVQGIDGLSTDVSLRSSSATNNQWIRNGAEIPGATSQLLEIHLPGSYQVMVSSMSGCTSISEATVITSFPEINQFNYKLYPNPAQNVTYIMFSKPTYLDRVFIYSTNGRIIREWNKPLMVGEILRLDLEGMAAGTYIIQIEGMRLMERIIFVKN